MNNELSNNDSQSEGPPSLSKVEFTTLFLSTLTDVHNIKTHLLGYLPLVAQKASYQKLRMAILEAALEVDAQILRMNIIFKMLRYEHNVRPEGLKGELDIGSYIGANLSTLPSYQTDFVLYTHLLMIENMEITYYRILQVLAKNIRHKQILSLIKQCLQEALHTRKAYDAIGKMYTTD